MSIDENVLDFPRAEVTPEESTRRVMVEATRLVLGRSWMETRSLMVSCEGLDRRGQRRL